MECNKYFLIIYLLLYKVYQNCIFTKNLQNEYQVLIENIVPSYLLSLSDEELKNVKKEDYEKIIKYLSKLFSLVINFF